MANTVNMATTENMQLMSRVDFHTHILPQIDDGSQSVEQSLRMLKLEKANGTHVVLATPHFYPEGPSITEFVATRAAALQKLMAHVEDEGEKDLPSIKLGAEVLMSVDLPDDQDLRQLCIEGTNYMLLEMPYDNWQPWVYNNVSRIIKEHGIHPVIAHVERYVPMQSDTQQIFQLLAMPEVLGQMNTRSLLNNKTKGLCHCMIKNNMVHVLGSDAHRGAHLIDLLKGEELIEKKHGQAILEKLKEQGDALIQNERVEKIYPGTFKRVFGGFYK